MHILITICARGGSKGIPGKNIKEINGVPLIAYTINTAKKVAEYFRADIALSTDDATITSVAEKYGLITDYSRPEEFATDKAGKAVAINHVIKFYESVNAKKYDFILDLDVTSPLRTVDDVKAAFDILKNNSGAINIFSVNEANRNPYFNMVEKKENGYYSVIKDGGTILSRQLAPKVYDMNASFCWFRRSFFSDDVKSATTLNSLIYIMDHICFDLDHPVDFDFMEYLICNNKLSFKL